MKSVYLIILCITQVSLAGSGLRFTEMTPKQIDSLLSVVSVKNLTITGRMMSYSELFLGTPYSFTCVGDGENALYEPYPLVNFKQTNCMAYCEHVLALSISDTWDNFFNNLQWIRYKNGQIGMRTRNHYTMADWLPENDWLLVPASKEVGGEWTRQVTRTISHKKFFEGKDITDMRHVIPDRSVTIDYIPKEQLQQICPNLQSGDIGSLIFDNKTDIFSAHMFMFFDRSGEWIVRESSNSKMTTFDTPLDEWIVKIKNSPKYIGISVMRVRPEINTAGRLILPDQIAAMKSEVQSAK